MLACWSLMAAVALQASPPQTSDEVALVVVGRTGLGDEEALVLAERVALKLKTGGFNITRGPRLAAKQLLEAGIADPASCEGQTSCARDLGALLRVPVIIAVDFGALRSSVAIHIESIAVADGSRLSQQDVSLVRAGPAEIPALDDFYASTRAAQEARRPPDAPVAEQPKLTPPDVEPPAVIARPERSSLRTAAPWVTGGLAVAAAATSATFFVLGNSADKQLARSTLADGRPSVGVPYDRAVELQSTANTDYAVSAVSAAGFAALTGVTIWLLASD